MQTIHKDKVKNVLDSLTNELYSAIKSTIDNNGGIIAFGNVEYFTSKGKVYESVNDNEPKELCAESDILLWLSNILDTLEDYLACKAAGNDKYSILWNYDIPKK